MGGLHRPSRASSEPRAGFAVFRLAPQADRRPPKGGCKLGNIRTTFEARAPSGRRAKSGRPSLGAVPWSISSEKHQKDTPRARPTRELPSPPPSTKPKRESCQTSHRKARNGNHPLVAMGAQAKKLVKTRPTGIPLLMLEGQDIFRESPRQAPLAQGP